MRSRSCADVPRHGARVLAGRPSSLLAIDRAPFLAAVTGHPGAFAAAERAVAGRAMWSPWRERGEGPAISPRLSTSGGQRLDRRSGLELDDAPADLTRVGVGLAVGEPNVGEPEPGRCGVGQEEVGAGTDPRADRVLQQPMRDRHGRTEQIAARSDRLVDRRPPVDDDLEVEMGDGRAGGAHVVAGRDRPRPAVDERAVHRAEIVEDPVALAVEPGSRRGGEDRVTLELDEGEVGLDTPDDRVEQGPEDRVRRRGCLR